MIPLRKADLMGIEVGVSVSAVTRSVVTHSELCNFHPQWQIADKAHCSLCFSRLGQSICCIATATLCCKPNHACLSLRVFESAWHLELPKHYQISSKVRANISQNLTVRGQVCRITLTSRDLHVQGRCYFTCNVWLAPSAQI